MRRLIGIISVVLSFGLVACGVGEDSRGSGTETVTSAGSGSGESGSKGKGNSVELNKPFKISTLKDNEVFLNIKELTVGQDCKFGTTFSEYRNDNLGSDFQYLQILAEVDVQKLDNPLSHGLVFLHDPKFVDGEGFTKEADSAVDCKSDNSYDPWISPTEVGNKTRRYGAFIVPKGVKEVQVENKKFAVN